MCQRSFDDCSLLSFLVFALEDLCRLSLPTPQRSLPSIALSFLFGSETADNVGGVFNPVAAGEGLEAGLSQAFPFRLDWRIIRDAAGEDGLGDRLKRSVGVVVFCQPFRCYFVFAFCACCRFPSFFIVFHVSSFSFLAPVFSVRCCLSWSLFLFCYC